jgi:ribosome biogenesis GTPase
MITLKNPETSSEFIDRVLVAAESYKIPVVLLFNKVDTYNEYEKELLEYYQLIYKVAGYKSIAISATEGVGMHDVKNEMQNKTSVVIGHSGTGKSTMLNAIEPDLKVKVAGISEYHKTGKHTTTFAEMYELSFGGFYIDTPGIRGFGLYNYKKEELHYYFPEIFALSKNCKFHNCTHTHEPACAVKEALENDELSEERYRNYLNIYYDDDLEKYR